MATVDEQPAARSAAVDVPRTTFSSLHIEGYRRLFVAGVFSFMAVQMQFLLRGILAWDLTEREGALGLVYLVFGLAMLVSMPLGGVAADRLPNRVVLLVAQSVLFVGAFGMGLVVVLDVVQYWMLLASAVATGTAFGFFGPTRVAFSAKLVGPDQLGNAITLSMLSMNGTRVIAPSFAGMLAGIAFFGVGGGYLVAAGFSALALLGLLRCPAGAVTSTPSGRSPFGDIVDGVRHVAGRPRLRRLALASFVVIMFGFNYVAFVPAQVEDLFGLSEGYVGLLMSASAVGAVVVAAWLAREADGPRARRLMLVSGAVFGASVVLLGLAPTYWVAWLVTVVVGAGATGFQSLSNTLALGMAGGEHQGRVQSLMMLSFAGFGIAAGPLGVLAEVIGLRGALVAMGGVTLVAMGGYAVLDRRGADAADTMPSGAATIEHLPATHHPVAGN